MKYYVNVDLLKNELQNARVHNLPIAPSNPVAGQLYYNTVTDRVYLWNNTEWVDLTVGVDEHALAGSYHTADTLAHLNAKITDATLDDINGTRVPKAHGNEGHTEDFAATGYVDTTTGTALTAAKAYTDVHEGKAAPHSGHEKTANKGTANGYASLDSSGTVPSEQLPATAKHRVFIVADEEEKNALTAQMHGDKAFVLSNGKTWIWNENTSQWVLQAKTDFSDVEVAWANLTDKPSSAVADIDDAVTKRHTHTNKTILDGITNVGSGLIITAAERTRLTSAPRKYSINVGNGSATSFTVTHNFNTRDLVVGICRVASPYDVIYADVEMTTVNALTIRFAAAPATNAYRVNVIG